jgi:hypothetical protein
MPMDRSRYPKNWNAIALQVKSEANWQCQDCGKPCRRPKQSPEDYVDWLLETFPDWGFELYDEIHDEEHGVIWLTRLGRYTLTVAHLDQDPANNDPKNLRALCNVCHLRYDAIPHARSRRRNRRAKLEADGQLSLALDA